ncbi:MAG: hypothetical protein IT346_01200 [Epsilonproteobacteria bacterium]|nr:hypothetical protein [Campylobacterota bacterium]
MILFSKINYYAIKKIKISVFCVQKEHAAISLSLLAKSPKASPVASFGESLLCRNIYEHGVTIFLLHTLFSDFFCNQVV